MVNQLLHAPSVRARELAAEGRLDEYEHALEVLFEIPAPATARAETAPPDGCPAHGTGDDDAARRSA